MRLRLFDGIAVEGRTIDLANDSVTVGADKVVTVIQTDGRADTPDAAQANCSSSGPGHDRLGRVPVSDLAPSREWLLAAVGRSRGHHVPAADDLDRPEAKLAEHRNRVARESNADDPERVDMSAAVLHQTHRRVAAAGRDEPRLRKCVTALRGRVNAHHDAGDDEATAATQRELVEATTELSEVETERVAAGQWLSTLEQASRAERDRRDARLKLEDTVENRRRDVWAYFAAELGAEFKATLRDLTPLPVAATPAVNSPPIPSTLELDPVARSLVAVRLVDLSAPVTFSYGRFLDTETAADWLGAPVVRYSPSGWRGHSGR